MIIHYRSSMIPRNVLEDEYDKALQVEYDNVLEDAYDNTIQFEYDNVLEDEYDNTLQVEYDTSQCTRGRV